MLIVLVHDHFEQEHLEGVLAEMRELGSPVVRAFRMDDCWRAVEGCHRIRAAAKIGIPVIVEEIELPDDLEVLLSSVVDCDIQDEISVLDFVTSFPHNSRIVDVEVIEE